ncbi:DUF1667 domain-containing protein [Clostridium sp. 19966]|uniref:DUF1667 domain-containing protein n=1 Tax=Clostridium sp. 19966 TaxID=2768166 RepID=UPI0028DE1094|nr:DUF1667 domain-containing protein [Clostridium sp. 19966]MDT8718877.1 DUF1667 domain-containing protein [Clostridium sp. 19966]
MIQYSIEQNHNKEIFTSTVRIKGSSGVKVVPVKSSKPIEKSLWFECSKALGRLYAGIPIRMGETVCKNILNTGADIICTKTIEKL